MNTIRTERHQTFDHDPRELGEDVAGSKSDAFAEFLLGVNRERKQWSWQNYVIDVAREMTIDEAREVYEMLDMLADAFRHRLENET